MLSVKYDKSDWLRVRNKFSAHAQKVGPGRGQMSRFLMILVLIERSAAYEDENVKPCVTQDDFTCKWKAADVLKFLRRITSCNTSFYNLQVPESNGPFANYVTLQGDCKMAAVLKTEKKLNWAIMKQETV